MIFTKKCFFVKKMQKMVGGVKKTLTFSFCPEKWPRFPSIPGYTRRFFRKKISFRKKYYFSRTANIIKILGLNFDGKWMILHIRIIRHNCYWAVSDFDQIWTTKNKISAFWPYPRLGFPNFIRFAGNFDGLVLGAQWELDHKLGHF